METNTRQHSKRPRTKRSSHFPQLVTRESDSALDEEQAIEEIVSLLLLVLRPAEEQSVPAEVNAPGSSSDETQP